MRTPTTKQAQYAWFRDALVGKAKIHPDDPQCGYFAVRAVRGGPLVPAVIWLEQDIDDHGQLADDEKLCCEVNGKRVDPAEYWDRLAGHPVPFGKFQYHKNLNYWAQWHQVDIPEARPTEPIDWNRVEPPVFK